MYGDDSQSEDTTLAEMEQQSQQILPEDDEQVTGHVLKDDEPTVPISTRTRELIPEQVEKVVSNGKNLFQDEISMPGQCDVVEAETETTETTAVQSKGMKRKRAQKQQVDLVEESSSSRTLSKFRLNLSRPSRFRTIDRFEESVLQVYTPPLPPMIREQSTLYQVNDLYSSEGDDQESQMVGSEAENTSIDTTRDVVSPFEPSSPEPEDLEIEDLPAAASTPLEFESSEEIFTGTEDNNNNIDENNETRRDNMVECVSKWNQDRAIEITDVCSQPVKRLNIAKAFQDLLVLQKEGQVKLIKEDNSLELKSIEKGPKLL